MYIHACTNKHSIANLLDLFPTLAAIISYYWNFCLVKFCKNPTKTCSGENIPFYDSHNATVLLAKVGIKSGRFAIQCASFVHAWM